MDQDESFLNPDIFNVHDITEIEGKKHFQFLNCTFTFLRISSCNVFLFISDFLNNCDDAFMRKLEQELATTDDTGLLSVDTKVKAENSPQSQQSPHYNSPGNPLVSQYTHTVRGSPQSPPNIKRSPVQVVPGYEDGYKLRKANDGAPLPDVTQHTQHRVPSQGPMIVQQVVQNPLYVNIASGSIHQLPDGRGSLLQLDSVPQVKQTNKSQQPAQPLLIQNSPKRMTPLILKTTDSNFSPVILQPNIISTEAQTLMYTSAPVQGKV